MKLQYKGVNQIKDLDTKQGIVQVYASQFNSVDTDGDIMMPGCFARTIKSWGPTGKNRIWKLFGHDTDKPIVKPLELTEDGNGLLCTAKMPDTQLGRDTLLMYENGDLTEHSIGFSTVKSEDDRTYTYSRNGSDVTGVNRILEVKLYEYSPVLWGANENTPVVGIKSEDFTLDDGAAIIKNTIKSLRNWKGSEEGYDLLEIKLIQWQSFMQEQIALAKSNPVKPLTQDNPQPDEAKAAAEFLQISEAKFFISKLNERLSKAV